MNKSKVFPEAQPPGHPWGGQGSADHSGNNTSLEQSFRALSPSRILYSLLFPPHGHVNLMF